MPKPTRRRRRALRQNAAINNRTKEIGDTESSQKQQNGKNERPQLALFDPPAPTYKRAAEDQHAARKEKGDERHMNGFYDRFFKGKSSVWMAIFTLAIVVFNGLLWRVSRQANEVSIATQRAFISFAQAGIEKVPNQPVNPLKQLAETLAARGAKKDGPPTKPIPLTGYNFHFALTNSGTTPTKGSIFQMTLATQDVSIPVDFDRLPVGTKTPYVFGPKGSFSGTPVFLTMDVANQIEKKTTNAIIWGWIVYRDIFPDTPIRLSEFCVQLTNPRWTSSVDHADPAGDILIDNPPCITHNCYDDNCEDYSKRIQDYR